VATRQWICAVVCETPITQQQVRALLGFALASRHGGIPDEIQFERGAVACDESLEALLTDIGVRVRRTSMDGGAVHAGTLKDRATGHFQGKGVIESNIRNHHNEQWTAPGQTGSDERLTAHANLETWKREALRRIEAGETPIAPSPEDMQARIFAAFERHNVGRPHGSLPELFEKNEVTGQLRKRHMTPNEYAKSLSDQAIRVLDERLLPLFLRKAVEVPVGKNGFRLNTWSYGRFDEDLQKYEGKTVTVYALKEMPDYAYVEELGRTVARFERPAYGAEGDLIDKKRAIESAKRNQYEALIARAMQADGPVTVDTVKFTSNPAPDRAASVCAPDALLQRAMAVRAGVALQVSKNDELDRRFDMSDLPASRRPAGESLSDSISAMREELAVMQSEI
jgi:hypothetical protein